MQFRTDYPLKELNTFGIPAKSRWYVELNHESELPALLATPQYQDNPVFWLGGGSNVLLTQNFPGLTVKLNFKGRHLERENGGHAVLTVAAGENWHQVVQYALSHKLGGLENLVLIPGNSGAAPMQNIGAYGVELKDRFLNLRAFDLERRGFVQLDAGACNFGYRSSIFKNVAKGRFVICSLRLRLSTANHQLNLEYGSIREELKAIKKSPSIFSIAEAVTNIRRSKLPDPQEIGNSGSFFKNPVISADKYQALKADFPEIKAFALADGRYKLAAGWLIEASGWKGYRRGDAGVHAQQALVLVNYGSANGTEIAQLAQDIKASVLRNFGVWLEEEVNLV